MLKDNNSAEEIALTLNISLKTVYKWQKKYAENYANILIKSINIAGRKYSKKRIIIKDKICEFLQGDCSLTQNI